MSMQYESYEESRLQKSSLVLKVPRRKIVWLFPAIVAICIIAIEVVAAFTDIIINATSGDGKIVKKSLSQSKGVLSGSVLSFHLTWGLILTLALSFVEHSLKWLMNHKQCNVFSSLNGILCGVFILIAVYTWMWADDYAGMMFICKYFLLSVNVRQSPESIMQVAYTEDIRYCLNLLLSWLFPAQCVVVLVHCILCFCKKPTPVQFKLNIRNKYDGMEEKFIVQLVDMGALDQKVSKNAKKAQKEK